MMHRVSQSRFDLASPLSLPEAWQGLLLAIVLSLPALLGAQELSFTATPQEPQPGDLIELRATLASDQYHTAIFTLPPQEGLHLVSSQIFPVTRSKEGLYESGKLWVVQALHSGNLSIEGLTAGLSGDAPPLSYPALTLQVLPPGGTEENKQPASWPANKPEHSTNSKKWVFLAGSLLTLLVVIFLKRRPASAPTSSDFPADPLRDFIALLRSGETGRAEAQALLLNEAATTSPLVRELLERAAYAPEFTPEALAAELETHCRP
jgi:hypothetical protein